MLFVLKNMLPAVAMYVATGWGGVVVEFSSAADFSDNFIIIDAGAAGSISYSADAGAAGVSGRLNVAVPETSGKMIYCKQPFSLREGPTEFSFRFLADEFTGSSNARIALGLSPDLVNLRSSARAQVRLINNQVGAATFEVRSASAGAVSASGVELQSNHWYRLEGSFSLSKTASGVDIAARLIDCGLTGSLDQLPVAETSGTRVDTAFFDGGTPKEVFAGFFVQNSGGGGKAIDDIRLPVADFREARQLASLFEVINDAGTTAFSTNTGIGGVSGRIDLSGITSASGEGLYSKSQIDPDDGKFGASFFLRAAAFFNNGNSSCIALGLSPDHQNLLGNAEVQARLIKGSSSDTATFEVRGGTGSNTSGIRLTDGNWYKFTATFAPYGAQSFQVDAILEDYGTGGTAVVSQVASASAIKASPSDFFDGPNRLPLQVGILAQNDGGGADALDQIRIPESTRIAPSKGKNNFSWRTTMGTHYRLYTNAMMGTIRSFPTPSKLSYYPDVTDLQPSNELNAVVGHFSGESRYYDFEGVLVRTNIDLDYGEYLRQAEAAHVDLIWNLGQIHYKHSGHVTLVMSNDGKYYKDLVYQAVVFANTGEFKNSPTTVYWEIGNEINSADRFSLADYGEIINNLSNAVDYLEYYLAPAVEAIREASQDIYGDPDQVKVLMGNISLLRTATTPDFLRKILDGVVVGIHAPTLAGKKGYELVNSMGIHYSKGTASVLDYYYNEWLATGKIDNMWNTEELGLAGLGDYDIVLHGFRWLDYWAQKPWSPETARLQFWGDQMPTSREREDGLSSETTGEGMQYFLGRMLQNDPLTRIDPATITLTATGTPEKYGFRADLPDGGARTILLIAAASDWSLSSVSLPVNGNVKYCEAYIQPVETTRSLWSCNWQVSNGRLTVTPTSSGLRLADEILLIVETLP